jgi:hypothetical protein
MLSKHHACLLAFGIALGACAGPGPREPTPPDVALPGAQANGPPEGEGQSGLDYGAWRALDPDARSRRFAEAAAKRFPQDLEPERLAGALQLDGFSCRDGDRPDAQPVPELECRLEAMHQGCAIDWVVELWPGEPAPRARVDTFCLGAER